MQGLTAATAMRPNSANIAYPGEFSDGTTAMDQCVIEQQYVRGGMTRTLLYSQARPVAASYLPLVGMSVYGKATLFQVMLYPVVVIGAARDD